LPLVVVSHSCVVTWFHTVKGLPVPPDWGWQAICNRAGFAAADVVVAPSQSHADMLVACYGAIENLVVIPNAVTGSSPSPSGSRKQNNVLAVGRWWDEGKNGRVIDEAALTCSWPVLMAGPTHGPNGQHFRPTNAEALGELPNIDIRALMASAGILVSPSIYEPFGLAALEAAQSRTPLVLADIPTYR